MNFIKIKNTRNLLIAILVVLLVFSFSNDVHAGRMLYFESKQGYTSLSSQESRIDTFTISIPQLGDRQRNIQVYLPPDYDSSEKDYPVFYLHAGQYLFNPPPKANGDYNVDETLDQLFFEGMIDGVIVVGIEIDADYDWVEYSPWKNENMHDWVSADASDSVEGGEGFAFLDFIVDTLKPEIDSRYRTLASRENTAIGGFCKNGFLPILAGIKYSNIFSKIMTMSPAVWFAEGGGRWLSNNRLIQYIRDNPLPDDVKFYIDIGTEESSGRRPRVRDQDGKRITYPASYVEGADVLARVLQENGVPESNINFRIIEGSSGSRDDRAKNFDEVVLWFFGEENVEAQSTPTEPTTASSAIESPTVENDVNEDEDQDNTIFLPSIQESENPEETPGQSKKPIILISSVLLVIFFALFLFLKKG